MVDKNTKPAANVDSTALIGMKEICAFLRRSEPTVLKLVEQYPASLPIKKVNGVYESDRLELERWRREVLLAPAGVKPLAAQEQQREQTNTDYNAKGPGEGVGYGGDDEGPGSEKEGADAEGMV